MNLNKLPSRNPHIPKKQVFLVISDSFEDAMALIDNDQDLDKYIYTMNFEKRRQNKPANFTEKLEAAKEKVRKYYIINGIKVKKARKHKQSKLSWRLYIRTYKSLHLSYPSRRYTLKTRCLKRYLCGINK